MHLIVGLGNPGPEYAHTPHNLGFLTIDALAEQFGIRVARPEAGALVGLGEIAGKPVVLAKPLSYMNLSGGPVKKLLEKYDLGPADLLVVYDELDFSAVLPGCVCLARDAPGFLELAGPGFLNG